MKIRIPLEQRFASYTAVQGDCIVWTGYRNKGYGSIRVHRRNRAAHRIAYELRHGPVPDGLVLDHLCRNKACVNPDHLEPVTQRENAMRGTGPSSQNAAKTHCNRGHPLSGENLRIWQGGQRFCLQCHHRRQADARQRKRARELAATTDREGMARGDGGNA